MTGVRDVDRTISNGTPGTVRCDSMNAQTGGTSPLSLACEEVLEGSPGRAGWVAARGVVETNSHVKKA